MKIMLTPAVVGKHRFYMVSHQETVYMKEQNKLLNSFIFCCARQGMDVIGTLFA